MVIIICMVLAVACQVLHLCGMSVKLTPSRTISFFDLSYFFLLWALLAPTIMAKV